jgi:ABC-type dipeptide/oligopeptide/nickel transport system permease subunit
MTVFPGLVLVLLAGCMTALGDWMRGVLNPRLGDTAGW